MTAETLQTNKLQLERITDLALSRPWSVLNGSRNFRILATLIRWSNQTGSLTILTDLEGLAIAAGLSYCDSIRDALNFLMAEGWLTWVIGDGSPTPELRNPSTIKLTPTAHEGTSSVELLPDPQLRLYSYEKGHGGSPAYLLVSRLAYNQGRTKLRSLKELSTFTGISYRTIRRLIPEMILVISKQADGVYSFDDQEGAYKHGTFDEAKSEERAASRIKSRVKDGTHDVRGNFIPPKQHTAQRGIKGWGKKTVEPPNEEKTGMLKNFDTIAPRPRPTSVAPVVEPAEVAETIEAPAGTIMAWLASRTADYGQSTPTPTPVAEEQPKAAPPKKVYTPWPGPGLAPSGYEWYQVPDDEKVNA